MFVVHAYTPVNFFLVHLDDPLPNVTFPVLIIISQQTANQLIHEPFSVPPPVMYMST